MAGYQSRDQAEGGSLKQTLIVRTDATSRIGSGHLMRCLALAQVWKDKGGRVVFLTAQVSPLLKKRLYSEAMDVLDLPVQAGGTDDARQTAELSRRLGVSWVVVDGYHFGAEYQRIIKNHGQHLLFVDDNGHSNHYYADLILNQNAHAVADLYVRREPYTRLLLGTRYALLRREFRKWAGWHRKIPEIARKVLVTLGGGDQDNATMKVIDSLQHIQTGGLEVVIVAGGSNPHLGQLQSAAEASTVPMRVEINVTNMPELMAWADIAVSAGGGTCWELAFLGLPNLILILADNQRPIAERLEHLGVAENLGWHSNVSPGEISAALYRLLSDSSLRSLMSERGRELVDGKGADRITNILMM